MRTYKVKNCPECPAFYLLKDKYDCVEAITCQEDCFTYHRSGKDFTDKFFNICIKKEIPFTCNLSEVPD